MKKARCDSGLFWAGKAGLFLRQHPGGQFVCIVGADLGIRRHGHGAPDTGTALDNFCRQLVNSVFLASVLGCNVFVGWADQFGSYRMAGHAVFGGGQLQVGQSWR